MPLLLLLPWAVVRDLHSHPHHGFGNARGREPQWRSIRTDHKKFKNRHFSFRTGWVWIGRTVNIVRRHRIRVERSTNFIIRQIRCIYTLHVQVRRSGRQTKPILRNIVSIALDRLLLRSRDGCLTEPFSLPPVVIYQSTKSAARVIYCWQYVFRAAPRESLKGGRSLAGVLSATYRVDR